MLDLSFQHLLILSQVEGLAKLAVGCQEIALSLREASEFNRWSSQRRSAAAHEMILRHLAVA